MSNSKKLLVLASLFSVLFVVANILATKKVEIGGLILTGGLVAFPFTFLITDMVNEVYGKKMAQTFVYIGFGSMIIALGLIQLCIVLPAAGFWTDNQIMFAAVLKGTFRITLGSLVAYLVSQTHDVFMFSLLSKLTKGKHLWLRNNVSTILSQIIDSVIFITVAFLGVVPNSALLAMITGQWVAKFLIALLDTPFCYWGVRWLKK